MAFDETHLGSPTGISDSDAKYSIKRSSHLVLIPDITK
jgi:hypothetical protein